MIASQAYDKWCLIGNTIAIGVYLPSIRVHVSGCWRKLQQTQPRFVICVQRVVRSLVSSVTHNSKSSLLKRRMSLHDISQLLSNNPCKILGLPTSKPESLN